MDAIRPAVEAMVVGKREQIQSPGGQPVGSGSPDAQVIAQARIRGGRIIGQRAFRLAIVRSAVCSSGVR
jgi:hypothetical protein